jgi:hypothetical protein
VDQADAVAAAVGRDARRAERCRRRIRQLVAAASHARGEPCPDLCALFRRYLGHEVELLRIVEAKYVEGLASPSGVVADRGGIHGHAVAPVSAKKRRASVSQEASRADGVSWMAAVGLSIGGSVFLSLGAVVAVRRSKHPRAARMVTKLGLDSPRLEFLEQSLESCRAYFLSYSSMSMQN